MQCKKCNAYIPEGYMYCPVCGEEIIIVSDFEIKLEDNIDMSVIADTVELPDVGENIASNIDNAVTKEINLNGNTADSIDNKNQAKPKMNPRWWILIGCTAAIIVYLCVLAGVNIFRYYSYDYQYEKGVLEANSGDYSSAIKTLKHLVKIDPTKDAKLLLADTYMADDNYDAAIAVLYDMLNDFSDDVSLYDRIVECYQIQGDNRGIHELIANSNDSTLALRYSAYVSLSPVFSLDSGKYIEPDPIEITGAGEGTIYYTTDSSTPTVESFEYLGPIPLDVGKTVISAIFVNDKGIVSDVVSCAYEVELNVPDTPVLITPAGSYEIPKLIGVEEYTDGNVYYIKGEGHPDNTSKQYKGPMLMPIGKSNYTFVAYDESGNQSSYISAAYNLSLKGSIEVSVAEYAISYQLTSMGEDMFNKSYKTEYGYNDGNRTYYVIVEYLGSDKTGRMFAVDINSGELFTIKKSNDTSYSISPL